MKFRIDVPIVDLSTVVFEIEAGSEGEAIEQACDLWLDYQQEILAPNALDDGERLELKPGAAVVEGFAFADQWIGTEIEVDLIE